MADEKSLDMEETSEVSEETEVSVEDELKKELDQYKDALLRERADFDNYKKRNALAVSKARTDGTKSICVGTNCLNAVIVNGALSVAVIRL